MAKKARTCNYFGIKLTKLADGSVEITDHVSDNHERHSMWCGMPEKEGHRTFNAQAWIKLHGQTAKHKGAEIALRSETFLDDFPPQYHKDMKAHLQAIIDASNPKIAAAVKANKKEPKKKNVKVSVTKKNTDGHAATVLSEQIDKIRQTSQERRKEQEEAA
jgi:hypothetical protein